MKKKALLIGTMAVAMVMSYEVISQNNEKANSLLLENIEALASGEGDNYGHCFGTGSVDCPMTHSKVEFYIFGFNLD